MTFGLNVINVQVITDRKEMLTSKNSLNDQTDDGEYRKMKNTPDNLS